MKLHSKRNTLIAMLGVFFVFMTFFTVHLINSPYSSELRFTEYSSQKNIVGSVVPASCETLRTGARTDESGHYTMCTCAYLYDNQIAFPGYYNPAKRAATDWPTCTAASPTVNLFFN